MNKRIEKRLVLKPKIKIFFSKCLISIIILLVGMILVKEQEKYKETFHKVLYERSLSFPSISKLYNQYFGNVLSIGNTSLEPVLSEETGFQNIEESGEGVRIKLGISSPVSSLETGVIVYLKNHMMIVEQVNGVEVAYQNINSSKKLYDYVEKGEIIGSMEEDYLYLTFQKNGEYLDYKQYM